MSLAGEFKVARCSVSASESTGNRNSGSSASRNSLSRAPKPARRARSIVAAPSVLIIGDGRKNFFQHGLRFEDVRFGQHIGGAINAKVRAVDDHRGQRLAADASEQRGAALFEKRQRGERGTQARSIVAPAQTFDDLLIFANDALARDGRDHFEIALRGRPGASRKRRFRPRRTARSSSSASAATGNASSARRGRLSNGRMKTRTTGSGTSKRHGRAAVGHAIQALREARSGPHRAA